MRDLTNHSLKMISHRNTGSNKCCLTQSDASHPMCVYCSLVVNWLHSVILLLVNDSVPPALSTVSNNRIWWRMDTTWMLHSQNCTLQEKSSANKKYQEDQSSGLQYIVLTLQLHMLNDGSVELHQRLLKMYRTCVCVSVYLRCLIITKKNLHSCLFFSCFAIIWVDLHFKWQQYVHSHIYQHTSKIKSERYYRRICLDTKRFINNNKKKVLKCFSSSSAFY